MTYSLCFTSPTGNTAALAHAIRGQLAASALLYTGAPAPQAAAADILFIGFWTDQGSCAHETAAFLQTLHDKKIFLFGTAGFGGDPAYFDQILARAAEHIAPTNTLIGSFMCQGKMPPTVRARYQALSATDPAKAAQMLANFDRALTHPDENDLDHLRAQVQATLRQLG